jgi:hypothetical protein
MLVLNFWDQLYAFILGVRKPDFGFYLVNLEVLVIF